MWWTLCVCLYAAWMIATDHLRSAPPRTLPAFPVQIAYYLIAGTLSLLGVRQRTEFSAPLDPKRRCLIACMPHGAYAFSGALFIGPQFRTGATPAYRSLKVFHCVASVLFFIPIVREWMFLIDARDASKRNVKRLLATTDASVTILPGGIWEQVNTRHDEERCYVQRRLGFIRLAIEEGLDIVPMYGFGENQLFTVHTVLNSLRLSIARRFQVGLPLISGRWGTLVPHPTHVTHVYGRPIPTKKQPDPSDAEVERVFVAFCDEVQRMYKENAGRLLPPKVASKPLRILRIGIDTDDRS